MCWLMPGTVSCCGGTTLSVKGLAGWHTSPPGPCYQLSAHQNAQLQLDLERLRAAPHMVSEHPWGVLSCAQSLSVVAPCHRFTLIASSLQRERCCAFLQAGGSALKCLFISSWGQAVKHRPSGLLTTGSVIVHCAVFKADTLNCLVSILLSTSESHFSRDSFISLFGSLCSSHDKKAILPGKEDHPPSNEQ